MLLEKTGSLIYKKNAVATGERERDMASLITSIASQHKVQTLSVLLLDTWIKPSSWEDKNSALLFCFWFFWYCASFHFDSYS